MSFSSRRGWITLGPLSLFAALSCKRHTSPSSHAFPAASAELLPDFGQLPSFQLIDHTGLSFTKSQLEGKVWITDFIFTRCTAVCPRLTQEMTALQKMTANTPNVGLLSISIDPEHDTVARLAAYASRHHADTARWRFLTGDKSVIREIQVKTQRHLDPDEITAHSKQFYLLDGEGFIRGIYSMTQPGRRDEIVADLTRLIASPARPQPVPEV